MHILEKRSELDTYLKQFVGCVPDYKAEWDWYRYQVGGKMFAALLHPNEKHGIYGGHDLLTLKCDPMEAEFLRGQYSSILPGFYTDKRNWISIFLDGDVPKELLFSLCEKSYALVFHKLTKKKQREITENKVSVRRQTSKNELA